MRLLIDGYNLMHVTDLFGTGDLEGTLRGSREALLNFLSSRLTESERKSTLIVFDAAQAIPGLPDALRHEGIQIRFSRGYPDADTLIEELLEDAVATKQLVVVSGDRRVQRAARSCGARPIDSATWFSDLRHRVINQESPASKPTHFVEGNQHWVEEFSDPKLLKELAEQQNSQKKQALPSKSNDKPKQTDRTNRKPDTLKDKKKSPKHADFGKGILDPFPPGYGEDLLEDD